MPYLDTNAARRPNYAAAAAVIAIEAALVLAVVRGLAVTFLPREDPGRTIAEDIPLPQPAPTEKPPEHSPDDRPTVTRPFTPPTGGLARPVDPIPLDPPSPVPSPAPTFQPPQPMPSPVALGQPAVPRGNPASWVSESDYPARDIREGNQGRVGFALSLGADGRVTACRVTSSSGHAGLDAATCTLVTRRARFSPATGPDGRPVAGSYSGTIRWVIPD